MNYSEQKNWKRIITFLPGKYHFNKEYYPSEEHWDWKGNDVHLDTFRNPDAEAKIILLHGVGTNGRQMSAIIGGPLAMDGYEVIAIDMPLYGVTEVNRRMTISYDDWVQLGSDYIDFERTKDERPIFLYGLSAGGMETYHIACRNSHIKGIIGMTFLDQRNQAVRNETTNNVFWAHFGTPLAGLSVKMGLGGMKMKMSVCSKMSALCNDKECLKELLADPTSAGNRIPMKFIYSYMNYAPETEPENFDVCPVLLTQPEKDRWTPLALSQPFLDRIKKVPVKITVLEDGSHFPVEETALEQLHDNILQFMKENLHLA